MEELSCCQIILKREIFPSKQHSLVRHMFDIEAENYRPLYGYYGGSCGVAAFNSNPSKIGKDFYCTSALAPSLVLYEFSDEIPRVVKFEKNYYESFMSSLCWSNDNTVIGTTCESGIVQLYDINSCKVSCRSNIIGPGRANNIITTATNTIQLSKSCNSSAVCRELVSLDEGNSIWCLGIGASPLVWDSRSGTSSHLNHNDTTMGNSSENSSLVNNHITSLALSPKDTFLVATGYINGELVLWDLRKPSCYLYKQSNVPMKDIIDISTGKRNRLLKSTEVDNAITGVEFDNMGLNLLVNRASGIISQQRFTSGGSSNSSHDDSSIYHTGISNFNETKMIQAQVVQSYQGGSNKSYFRNASFAHNDKHIIAGDDAGVVHIFDASSGKEIQTLEWCTAVTREVNNNNSNINTDNKLEASRAPVIRAMCSPNDSLPILAVTTNSGLYFWKADLRMLASSHQTKKPYYREVYNHESFLNDNVEFYERLDRVNEGLYRDALDLGFAEDEFMETFADEEVDAYEVEDWERDDLDLDVAECSYQRGYRHQILYTCVTCIEANEGEEVGVMCGQCAYWCHERVNHEVKNIGAKRGFRCDCGNSKFPQNSACGLHQQKSNLNSQNNYDIVKMNAFDRWCFCLGAEDRPMIQCVTCENWFHGKCIDSSIDWANDTEIVEQLDELDFICNCCFASKDEIFTPILLPATTSPNTNNNNNNNNNNNMTTISSDAVGSSGYHPLYHSTHQGCVGWLTEYAPMNEIHCVVDILTPSSDSSDSDVNSNSSTSNSATNVPTTAHVNEEIGILKPNGIYLYENVYHF